MPYKTLSILFLLFVTVLTSYGYTTNDATFFTFSDNAVTVSEGPFTGYKIKGTAVTLSSEGTYVFSGSCSNGSIKVKKETLGTVRVVLAGLDLTAAGKAIDDTKLYSATAPLLINKSNTVIVEALDGTVNTLTDSVYNNDDLYAYDTTVEDSEKENAVVKCKAGTTVTLCGTGTLNVNANGKNGIKSGSGATLKIKDLALNITCGVNDGISADNLLKIYSGTVTVNATAVGGDAVKASPDDDDTASLGDIVIYGGTLDITADDDGIKAQNEIYIAGGTIVVNAGGDGINSENVISIDGGDITVIAGSDAIQGGNSSDDDTGTDASGGLYIAGGTIDVTANGGHTTILKTKSGSYKGLKGGDALVITGGDITVDSADDCLHCDNEIAILGGALTLATSTSGGGSGSDAYSGGDAIHADNTLVVGVSDGGTATPTITVSSCYEGLEGATIYVLSGTIDVNASDDGFNAANKDIASESTTAFTLNFYGGKVTVVANGDGLDSNGNLKIYGGDIEVHCTASGGNNSLDVADRNGYLAAAGGTLVALGPRDMAVTPTASYSTTPYVSFGSSSQGGGPGGGFGGGGSSSFSITKGSTWSIRNSSGVTLATGTAKSTVSFVVFASSALTANQTCYLYAGSTQKASATATAAGRTSITQDAVPTVETRTSAYARTENDDDDDDDDDDIAASFEFSDAAITKISGSDEGYAINGTVITITSPGTYSFTGSCSEGSVQITKGLSEVILILNGLALSSNVTAPILVGKGSACTVMLASNTTSTLSDGTANTEKAVVKGKDSASITFDGDATSTLIVNANTKNGIKGGANGVLTFRNIGVSVTTTVNDAISCDHQLVIESGTFLLNSASNGLKAEPDEDDTTSEGSICVSGGDIAITSEGDAISGLFIDIQGGTFTVTSEEDGLSAYALEMTGGTMTVHAVQNGLVIEEDAYVSNANLYIYAGADGDSSALYYGGAFNMSSGYLIATDGNTASSGVTNADGNLESYSLEYDYKAGETVTIRQGAEGTAVLELDMPADGSHIIIAGDEISEGEDVETTQTLRAGHNAVTLLVMPDDDTLAGMVVFGYDTAKRVFYRAENPSLRKPYWIFCKETTILSGTVKSSPFWIADAKSGWQFIPCIFAQSITDIGAQVAWQWSNGKFKQVTGTMDAGSAYWIYK